MLELDGRREEPTATSLLESVLLGEGGMVGNYGSKRLLWLHEKDEIASQRCHWSHGITQGIDHLFVYGITQGTRTGQASNTFLGNQAIHRRAKLEGKSAQ